MSRRHGKRRPLEEDISAVREMATLRIARKISRDALAAHLGISTQQLSKYESGDNRMSVGTYRRAMTFLLGNTSNGPYGPGFAEAQIDFGVTAKPDDLGIAKDLDAITEAVDRIRAKAAAFSERRALSVDI